MIKDLVKNLKLRSDIEIGDIDDEDIKVSYNGEILSHDTNLSELMLSKEQSVVVRATKTIYIAEVDEFGEPLGKLSRISIHSERIFKELLSFKRESWLASLDDPDTWIFLFSDLVDGMTYRWRGLNEQSAEKAGRWILNEAKAFRNELRYTVVDYLKRRGLHKVSVHNGELYVAGNRIAQEWDGAVFSEDEACLYLIEAKHSFNSSDIEKIDNKLKIFADVRMKSTSSLKHVMYESIKIVACGSHFSPDIMDEVTEKGFLVCRLSGERYTIEVPG